MSHFNPDTTSADAFRAGVAVASSSQLAADAGAYAAGNGGNAVDAAIAAALISMTTEPGVCSLGGGGHITIWPPASDPVTIDGYVDMPGLGFDGAVGQNTTSVTIEYGAGLTTVVGPGSIAVPGAVGALGVASERFGALPWRALFEPAIERADSGFPLCDVSYHYMRYAAEPIYSWQLESREILLKSDGTLHPANTIIRVPGLTNTLREIADDGPDAFYTGRLAQSMAHDLERSGSMLTVEDLAAYRPVVRQPLQLQLDDWQIATNPLPAIGGVSLAAMLLLMRGHPNDGWSASEVEYLIRVQQKVLGFRRDRLDLSEEVEAEAESLLRSCSRPEILLGPKSPSTVHTSAVDGTGLACSLTMSAGYGSGLITNGIWTNNCLGELELNRQFVDLPPGRRLPSNMAPTIARGSDGATLAIGSPGADRITTAILQTLVNLIHLGMPLDEAIAHPRAHVIVGGPEPVVAYEAGLPVDQLPLTQRRFDRRAIYFGGVAAAMWEPPSRFSVGADKRRSGGTAVIEPG